eukprot:Opistho-1_new@38708
MTCEVKEATSARAAQEPVLLLGEVAEFRKAARVDDGRLAHVRVHKRAEGHGRASRNAIAGRVHERHDGLKRVLHYEIALQCRDCRKLGKALARVLLARLVFRHCQRYEDGHSAALRYRRLVCVGRRCVVAKLKRRVSSHIQPLASRLFDQLPHILRTHEYTFDEISRLQRHVRQRHETQRTRNCHSDSKGQHHGHSVVRARPAAAVAPVRNVNQRHSAHCRRGHDESAGDRPIRSEKLAPALADATDETTRAREAGYAVETKQAANKRVDARVPPCRREGKCGERAVNPRRRSEGLEHDLSPVEDFNLLLQSVKDV